MFVKYLIFILKDKHYAARKMLPENGSQFKKTSLV